ncbi:Crp/Fnr family transcriptional regulator [Spirochaetia bacterium]|nr:Crp/Fnr family transcriptional regulator [Spirochaetia bacterium]
MPEQLQLAFVNFAQDAYIILEGKQNADRFYIIRQGKVRISKQIEVVEEEGGNILGPGDYFGVVSTMSGHSSIETVQAVTDCVLISVKKDQYINLIQSNASLAMKIIGYFSRQLRYFDEALTRLTLKSSADTDQSHIFDVAEYYINQSQYNLAYYAYYQYINQCPDAPNVTIAQERLTRIAPYVKDVKLGFKADEFTRAYAKNRMLFAEGERGDELFIIQSGAVKIVKIVDRNEVLLAVLKTGDIFGEMALLDSKPRTACAVAYEDCVVMRVNRANFERITASEPSLITRLTTLLADRIWLIYKQLANTLITDPLGRLYDALMIQLENNRVPLDGHQAYTFNFGPQELVNMMGLPKGDSFKVLRLMLESKQIQVKNDKVHIFDVIEVVKQATYHQKLMRMEKARRAASLK